MAVRGVVVSQIVTLEALRECVGQELGRSAWYTIDQERINAFADVTEDHQFVHIDPERARSTPFGTTVAHGFLTLSLLVHLCLDFIPELENRQLMLNYGFDKVRFVSPVKVGARIRAQGRLVQLTERKPGQILMNLDVVVEIDNEDKPALIVEWLSLHIVGAAA